MPSSLALNLLRKFCSYYTNWNDDNRIKWSSQFLHLTFLILSFIPEIISVAEHGTDENAHERTQVNVSFSIVLDLLERGPGHRRDILHDQICNQLDCYHGICSLPTPHSHSVVWGSRKAYIRHYGMDSRCKCLLWLGFRGMYGSRWDLRSLGTKSNERPMAQYG